MPKYPGAQHCTGPHLPNGASPGDGLVAPRGYGGLDKWGGSPCARGLEVFYDEATALVALPMAPGGHGVQSEYDVEGLCGSFVERLQEVVARNGDRLNK